MVHVYGGEEHGIDEKNVEKVSRRTQEAEKGKDGQ